MKSARALQHVHNRITNEFILPHHPAPALKHRDSHGSKIAEVVRNFFPLDHPTSGIAGAIVLSILGNSATQVLTNTFGTSSLSILVS
jgi:hypothetical protein